MNPPASAAANVAILEPGLALARPSAAPQPVSFEQIMSEHNQRLYRLAFSLMGEESEAEDVLQASYVRAFQKLQTFAGRSSLGAWLASIVRHEAIDQLRARRVRRSRVTLEADLLRTVEDEPSGLAEVRSDSPEDSPEIGVHREQSRKMLERAIASLPSSFRAVFLLREVEGLSIQETAEYLGVPPATVKTRDYRARSMLRGKLGDQVDAATWQVFEFLGARCASLTARVMERLAK